jgi:5-methylthioadenosine/S-adenosylhomocysteine deaminase
MDFFMDAAAGAVKDAGIRAVLARGLVGGRDNPEGGRMRLNQAFDALAKWKDIGTITFMLGPHAPNTCDDSFQKEVAAAAERLGLRIRTHISESRSEVETIRAAYGCTTPELMDRCGLLTDRTVAAHCVHVTDGDIGLLAKRGVSVVTNPVSNLKLANGVAPVPKMLQAGLNIALGTDGASSNNTLNMFREMGFLSLLHKGITGNPQMITAPEALGIATRNGARALGFEDVGEIRVGFKADLAILDLDRPNLQPLNAPGAALAYSANGSEIETVLVGGRILYEKGSFTTIDKEKGLSDGAGSAKGSVRDESSQRYHPGPFR